MRATEINLEKEGFTFSCNTYLARSHYKMLMLLGRVFPMTKAQAHHFISNGICLDVLNADDVAIVENQLNSQGFSGNYSYTKSKSWVRLKNQEDLHAALKKEYSL